jgi:hypothetical protein
MFSVSDRGFGWEGSLKAAKTLFQAAFGGAGSLKKVLGVVGIWYCGGFFAVKRHLLR